MLHKVNALAARCIMQPSQATSRSSLSLSLFLYRRYIRITTSNPTITDASDFSKATLA